MVGSSSGYNITSSDSVFVGYQAGQAATSGLYNVALGSGALNDVTTGNRNIGIGRNAGDGFDTESDNIAIGYDALGGAVAGGEMNVVIGNYAGDAVTSGDGNTLLGHTAGGAITTGSHNITLGYLSGDNLTTGSGNVVIGRHDPASNTGDNQLVISNAKQTSFGGRTWILGNDLSQVNSKVNVVAISSNTTLSNVGEGQVEQSGAIIYWTGGTLTLPYNATVGTQYTIINNTGSAAKPSLNTNGDFLNGTHGNIDDKNSRTYVCLAAANTGGGSPDWWGIG